MVIQINKSLGNFDMTRDAKYIILEGIQHSKLDNVTIESGSRKNTKDWCFDFLALVSEFELKRDINNM